MSPTRRIARPLLAAGFVADGVAALKNPAPAADAVRAAGIGQPEQVVKAGGATMTLAGLTLATGRLPRLSALALALVHAPTAYGRTRSGDRTTLLKDLGLLGGLLVTLADTGGRESLPHAAGRVSRRAARKARKAAQQAEQRVGLG